MSLIPHGLGKSVQALGHRLSDHVKDVSSVLDEVEREDQEALKRLEDARAETNKGDKNV